MSLKESIAAAEKLFGKGAVQRVGSKEIVPVKAISTGSLSLDRAIGIGGFPRGRVVEVYGSESSGKTTLALETMAEAQALGGKVAIVDAEHALDLTYARAIGVKVEDLLISQPDCGEEALEIADLLVKSNELDVIVVDSVAALVPRAELDGEMADNQMGLQARLMSKALRKLTGNVAKSQCVLIFINQMRDKIGGYGNPETTTGGKALKFYASVRIDVRRKEALKENDQIVGLRVRAKVIKNKVSAPLKEAEFDIRYGEGISKEGDVIDLAVSLGIVEKSGAWLSYGGEHLAQGRANAVALLKEDGHLGAKLEAEVRKSMEVK